MSAAHVDESESLAQLFAMRRRTLEGSTAASSRCSDCGLPLNLAAATPEHLCPLCLAADRAAVVALTIEARTEIGGRIEHRETLPVEYARSAIRPFGLGFGELPSSRITQALAEDRRGNPPVVAAFAVVASLCTLLGLLVLAVAAVR